MARNTGTKLFHRTSAELGALLLREGFLDRPGRYTSDFSGEGVWFSDEPQGCVEREYGEAVVSVELRISARALSVFERLDDQDGYREWLIPLALVKKSLVAMRLC